jgi:hypothetical protein
LALDFARHGETEPLAAMLGAGLQVNLSDPKGDPLLMLACYCSNEVQTMARKNAPISSLELWGLAPLYQVSVRMARRHPAQGIARATPHGTYAIHTLR